MNTEDNNFKNIPGFIEWRDRINNLQEVEGWKKPDFNHTWARLEMRMTEPPKRKKSVIVYWAAAACLLLLISIAAFMQFRQHPQEMVKKPVPKSKPAIEKITTPQTINEIAAHTEDKKDPVQQRSVKNQQVIIDKPANDIAQQPKQQQDSNRFEAIVPKEVLTALKAAPVNPDDREPIHLNEIKFGAPVTPVAGNNKRKTLSIQLRDQQASISIGQDEPVNDQSLHEN